MRTATRPIIDIQRVPTGEMPLDELVADVYGWIFQNKPYVKSSVDTFVTHEKAHYNSGVKMNSGGNNNGTAA